MGVSAVPAANRAFVTVLLELAVVYGLVLQCNRDSADNMLHAAYKKVICKAHPDKGGRKEHAQKLQAAREEWSKALKTSSPVGGRPRRQPSATASPSPTSRPGRQPWAKASPSAKSRPLRKPAAAPAPHRKQLASSSTSGSQLVAFTRQAARDEPGYLIRSLAVQLTYLKVAALSVWPRFVRFVKKRLVTWQVRYWCATMETCANGEYHFHLMLQFHASSDSRQLRQFFVDDLKAGASPTLANGFVGRSSSRV